MHLEINANGFELTPPIADHVRERVTQELARFEGRITRVEAHLGDHNSHKKSDDDKRCMLEARPRGLDPIAVTAEGADLYTVIGEAAGKLRRALATRLGKLDDASKTAP
ncbi:MAG: HPF/RaiA family ribosome-associated protein [Phycisphaerales bacterium]